MKFTERCGHEGCTFETTQASQAVARRVAGIHRRLKHGIVGGSASAQWKAKHGQSGARKSEHAPQPQPEAPPMVVPNFCPNCGCSIRTVMAAMNLRPKR